MRSRPNGEQDWADQDHMEDRFLREAAGWTPFFSDRVVSFPFTTLRTHQRPAPQSRINELAR